MLDSTAARDSIIQEPFTFYATFDSDSIRSYIPQDVALLLPASSWARHGLPSPPAYMQSWKTKGADSGGYIASHIWGEYRYSLEQYVTWLETWKPQWAATMDYCCEQELSVVTRDRQEKTTCNAWQAWNNYRNASWAWTPTIQGLYPEDYRRHAHEMKTLIDKMKVYYADNPEWRIGVGTLCRRDDVELIQKILDAVREVLPDVSIHLWGIKLDALRSVNLKQVRSSDSGAHSGKWGTELEETRKAAAEAETSISKYCIMVKLPRYLERVEAAVAESYSVVSAQEDKNLLFKYRSLLHAHGWTIHPKSQRNRTYVYAARRKGEKTRDIYLCPLNELSMRSPSWVIDQLDGTSWNASQQFLMEVQACQ